VSAKRWFILLPLLAAFVVFSVKEVPKLYGKLITRWVTYEADEQDRETLKVTNRLAADATARGLVWSISDDVVSDHMWSWNGTADVWCATVKSENPEDYTFLVTCTDSAADAAVELDKELTESVTEVYGDAPATSATHNFHIPPGGSFTNVWIEVPATKATPAH
jgi:hypothetical protein